MLGLECEGSEKERFGYSGFSSGASTRAEFCISNGECEYRSLWGAGSIGNPGLPPMLVVYTRESPSLFQAFDNTRVLLYVDRSITNSLGIMALPFLVLLDEAGGAIWQRTGYSSGFEVELLHELTNNK